LALTQRETFVHLIACFVQCGVLSIAKVVLNGRMRHWGVFQFNICDAFFVIGVWYYHLRSYALFAILLVIA
jgi:hypothetical protein